MLLVCYDPAKILLIGVCTSIKTPLFVFCFVLGLTSPTSSKEYVDFTLLDHYSNLYSKCLINLAERAVKRMKDDDGSIIFISSPGCNITQSVTKGYDMPGIEVC